MNCLLLLALLPLCAAQGMPSQSSTDTQFWSNLAGGGVSARPYISDASVVLVPGGASTVLWAGAASASLSPPAGYEATPAQLSAVLSPVNMCATGQSPSGQNTCYLSPNRLGLVLGTTAAGPTLQADLTGGAVTAASVFDLTLNLGSFSGRFGWAWANADVRYWQLRTDPVSNVTTLRVQMAPVRTPVVDFTPPSLPAGPQCCTCDIPSSCAANNSLSWRLNANLILQLQDPSAGGGGGGIGSMTGAVFATTNAVMGALALGNSGSALQYSLASSHFTPEGTPMLGELRAFVPSATVAAVFGAGVTPDALNVTRTGDAGTQASVTIAAVSASTFGADGMLMTVSGVTFSVPTYTLTRPGGGGGSSAAPGAASVALMLACALLAALAF